MKIIVPFAKAVQSTEMDSLKKFIERVRENLSLQDNVYLNETSVREQIVMPVLRFLDWDVANPSTVRPEYQITNYQSKSRKVDYALFAHSHSQAPSLIIEVKAIGKVDADDQLFEYAFITGVELAILTDGREWRVYLPIGQGTYQERLVRTIDLLGGGVDEASKALQQFLSFENISSGESIANARTIYKERRSLEVAKSRIGEAWTNLTSGTDAKIIDLIVDETSRISGTPPKRQDVVSYLGQMKSQPQPINQKHAPNKVYQSIPKPQAGSKGKRVVYWLYNEEYSAKNLTVAYREIMEKLVHNIPQTKLEQIKFIWNNKMDITQSHRKTAHRLTNGMFIHIHGFKCETKAPKNCM